MNLHREHKSAYEIQSVMHMAFPNLGFITTHVINIHFLNVNYNVIVREESKQDVISVNRRFGNIYFISLFMEYEILYINL